MDAVKSEGFSRVRSLSVLKTPSGTGTEPMMSEACSYTDLLSKVEALTRDNKFKEKQIATYEQQLAKAEELQSQAVAMAQIAAREDERQTILTSSQATIEKGIESLEVGRKAFETFLNESENLALIVAETALRKVFVANQSRSELVASAIARCVTEISARSIVNVRLSGDDFGDPSEVHDYEPQLESQRLSFEIDPALRRGDCVFELLVGQLEISLDQHWSKLESLLKSLRSDALSVPDEDVPS